jgi:hypothetical protein
MSVHCLEAVCTRFNDCSGISYALTRNACLAIPLLMKRSKRTMKKSIMKSLMSARLATITPRVFTVLSDLNHRTPKHRHNKSFRSYRKKYTPKNRHNKSYRSYLKIHTQSSSHRLIRFFFNLLFFYFFSISDSIFRPRDYESIA